MSPLIISLHISITQMNTSICSQQARSFSLRTALQHHTSTPSLAQIIKKTWMHQVIIPWSPHLGRGLKISQHWATLQVTTFNFFYIVFQKICTHISTFLSVEHYLSSSTPHHLFFIKTQMPEAIDIGRPASAPFYFLCLQILFQSYLLCISGTNYVW